MSDKKEVTAEFCQVADGRKIITISGLPGDGCEFTPAGLSELAKLLSDMAKSAKQNQITKAVRSFEPLKS
jgi:hypothetical protein